MPLDRRQLRRIEPREPRGQVEGHQLGAEIVDLAGEVPELPFGVDQAWLFGALGAVADELHGSFPGLVR